MKLNENYFSNATTSSNMAEKQRVFADGFLFKTKDNAPDFVIGQISIKVEEAVEFLQNNARNGWVNLDAKYGWSGKPYLELDTFVPDKAKGKAKAAAEPQEEISEELPF
jgi:hypothetical protein